MTASSEGRWYAVGRSAAADADRAVREAGEQALGGRPDADLLVVFWSIRHDAATIARAAGTLAPGAAVVGCSTAGEIATDGPGDGGVVIAALGGGFSVATAVGRRASQRLREAGADAAACATGLDDPPHRVLLLLTDGLAGDQQEIVRGAHGIVGADVPLVGGCAGDDLAMAGTLQLCGDEVLDDSVVGVAIGSDAPLGIGVRHGWRRVGDAMLVTRSENNRVYTLDDEPALDVYLRRLDAPPEAHTDPAAFTRFALTHPLGLARRSGEEQVRFGADAQHDRRGARGRTRVVHGGRPRLGPRGDGRRLP
jgi:hypothetical protein